MAPDRRLTQSEPCLFEPGSLTVRRVDAYRWSLVDDLVYQGRWERFVIPAGFRTDFATVPRVVTRAEEMVVRIPAT